MLDYHNLLTQVTRRKHVTHHPAPHICHLMSKPSHAAWHTWRHTPLL